MQKAAFSLEKYQFDKVNIDLFNHKNNNFDINFDQKGIFFKKDSKFELTFSVKAFNDDVNKPFIFIQCIATFKFEEIKTLEEIPEYFYKNSIAILFPFVRAYLSMVTMQANVPLLLLPTLNLMSLSDPLKQNTIEK